MPDSSPPQKFPLAVLISGGGTTLKNLLDRIADGRLAAEVRLVISSNRQAGGLQFAADAGVPARVVERSTYGAAEAFRDTVFDACREAGVQLVVMGGFLKHLLIPPDFENRVINIHPALMPAFCGKGFYGLRVHQAVLEYGAKVSGCTVHFVDNHYDHGPIILQRVVEVLDDDTPETLQTRVFQQECQALPDAIQWIAAGRVRVDGRRVAIGGMP